jgi:lysophospholipase L1-like esterase
MRRALFWTMLPLMAPQALWVRRTAPRFADAAGPAFGSVGTGRPMHLVAVGDSIIAGVGAPTLDDALVGQTARALAEKLSAEFHWQALGRTGERSAGLVSDRLATLPDVDADYVIVSMGVNDVTGLSTRRHYAQNMRRTLRGLRLRYPRARIAVAGLPPMDMFPVLPQPLRAFLGMRARMLSKTLKTVIAGQSGTVFVPIAIEFSPDRLSEDGFHPSPLGYRDYGEAMAQALAATPAPPR